MVKIKIGEKTFNPYYYLNFAISPVKTGSGVESDDVDRKNMVYANVQDMCIIFVLCLC